MKKNLLIILITVIATTSIIGLFAFKSKMPESEKEIAIVTTISNGWIIVNVGHGDSEFIETKSLGGFGFKNAVAEMNTKLNGVFSKFYSQGFHLESSSGGDVYTNYVFVK